MVNQLIVNILTYSYTHSLTTNSYSQRNVQISARIGDDPSNQQN